MLALFWEHLEYVDGRCCGYNILGFDLPFILRRSLAQNVAATLMPDLRRYQTFPTTDLYGLLYHWQPGKGLKTVCDLYGIPNALPELKGNQVADMDESVLRAYAANDVQLCLSLFERMATAGYTLPFVERPRLSALSDATLAVSAPIDEDVFPF